MNGIKLLKTIEDFDNAGLLHGLTDLEKIEVGNYMCVINTIIQRFRFYESVSDEDNTIMDAYMFVLPMFRRIYSMLLGNAEPNISQFNKNEELRHKILESFDVYDFIEYADRMWQHRNCLIFLRNTDYEAEALALMANDYVFKMIDSHQLKLHVRYGSE